MHLDNVTIGGLLYPATTTLPPTANVPLTAIHASAGPAQFNQLAVNAAAVPAYKMYKAGRFLVCPTLPKGTVDSKQLLDQFNQGRRINRSIVYATRLYSGVEWDPMRVS